MFITVRFPALMKSGRLNRSQLVKQERKQGDRLKINVNSPCRSFRKKFISASVLHFADNKRKAVQLEIQDTFCVILNSKRE